MRVVALCMLASCGASPDYEVRGVEVYHHSDPASVERAIGAWLQAMRPLMPARVAKQAIEGVKVFFEDLPRHYHGLQDGVRVRVEPTDDICIGALMHELTHVAIWRQLEIEDPRHQLTGWFDLDSDAKDSCRKGED